MMRVQLSIHELKAAKAGDNTHVILMKGAPERIVERCSTIYMNGADVPLSGQWLDKFHKAYEALGGLGERVLGFCDKHVKYQRNYAFDADKPNFAMSELRFVGLISLIDPPRPNVPAAIAKCRQAGIRVVMVTGDHPTTAKAIARIIGLISDDSPTFDELNPQHRASAPALQGSVSQSVSPPTSLHVCA